MESGTIGGGVQICGMNDAIVPRLDISFDLRFWQGQDFGGKGKDVEGDGKDRFLVPTLLLNPQSLSSKKLAVPDQIRKGTREAKARLLQSLPFPWER